MFLDLIIGIFSISPSLIIVLKNIFINYNVAIKLINIAI